jgi:hypothetical protein
MLRAIVAVALASLATGCTGIRGPIEDPGAGPRVAVFELLDGGRTYGEARVTASDVADEPLDGGVRAVLRAQLTLENDSDEELLLRPQQVAITFVETKGGRLLGAALPEPRARRSDRRRRPAARRPRAAPPPFARGERGPRVRASLRVRARRRGARSGDRVHLPRGALRLLGRRGSNVRRAAHGYLRMASWSRSTRSSGGQRHGRRAPGGALDPGDEPRAGEDPGAPRRPHPRALGPRHAAHAARARAQGRRCTRRHRGAARARARAPLRREPSCRPRSWCTHDYVLTIIGAAVDRILRDEAPRVCVRFVPNTPDDPPCCAIEARTSRSASTASCRRRCGAARSSPIASSAWCARATRLEEALHARPVRRLSHMQVAPRGKPGGYLDDVLRERGLTRTVARAVPVLRHGAAARVRDRLRGHDLRAHREALRATARPRLLEVPVKLRPYALSLVWHPRVDADAGHRFLRDVFVRASKELAASVTKAAHAPRPDRPDLGPDPQAPDRPAGR